MLLGWVQKLKRRNGIRLRRIHGEASSINTTDMEKQWKQLRDLLDEYSPADVYNFDEAGLYFWMVPSQSLATKAIRGRRKTKNELRSVCVQTWMAATSFQSS